MVRRNKPSLSEMGKQGGDRGMTLLEVVVAMAIFLIGIGFIMQSNAVSYRYRHMQEVRQQMIFYAAGQMEALLEHQTVSESTPPFKSFVVEHVDTPDDGTLSKDPSGAYLQQIQITVSDPDVPGLAPVSLNTYRVWVNP
ncbi:hypothetical protein CEB3_c45710 [Peptococcaceae bacterium CEB3]|nr:hypothetical protein CEB3_c45710 [Peptococcaceae bacterium CEB3]